MKAPLTAWALRQREIAAGCTCVEVRFEEHDDRLTIVHDPLCPFFVAMWDANPSLRSTNQDARLSDDDAYRLDPWGDIA